MFVMNLKLRKAVAPGASSTAAPIPYCKLLEGGDMVCCENSACWINNGFISNACRWQSQLATCHIEYIAAAHEVTVY